MSSSPAALSVENMSVFVGSRQIVSDLTFEIATGERVCLLGASGSGKSLTASAILGLLPANGRVQGSIKIQGHEVANVAAALRPKQAQAAMVFQDSHSALNPLVSIGAQLREPLRRRQELSNEMAERRAVELLDAMGLPDPINLLKRCPAEISGGQRQRVCIALALACKTSLLVADEPTTALDVITQAQVLRVLKQNTETADAPATLFITHDLGAALQLCDRAIFLERGTIIESGPLTSILASPRHPFTRSLITTAQAGVIETVPQSIPYQEAV